MKIFVLNCGSSSIKCYLYDFDKSPQPIKPVWEAHLQWKNLFDEPSLSLNKKSVAIGAKTVKEALRQIVGLLLEEVDQVDVIGHRVVHGGEYFSESVLVTDDVKEKIGLLSELAPLHNLSELEGIEILEEVFKDTPHVAVFDTAFHHTLPKTATVYPGPYSWYEEGIRRYGFHGISYQYCSKRGAQMVDQDLKSLKMVICHLGSGASLCALKGGKSIETTMGFTPLEGLMMDTRSGSIDPGILLHFLRNKKKSVEELSEELYQRSGLFGISGISSDMRDIIQMSSEGDEKARFAFELYLHQLNGHIGAMIAQLEGLDVLIFTAGIGENASLLRERVCKSFSFLGVEIDPLKNQESSSEDRVLSTENSKVKVLTIHTQEAFEIASECWKKMGG